MKLLNIGTADTLKDDLAETIKPHSKISMAAASFSLYAYKELREQLADIDELKFLFTEPAFVRGTYGERKESYLPRQKREKNLYGTEFETALRNELDQKAIATECADWVRAKAKFRSNKSQETVKTGFINVNREASYIDVKDFSTVDLGVTKGNYLFNNTLKISRPFSDAYIETFRNLWNDRQHMKDVTEDVLASLNALFKENSPELIYYLALNNIFSSYLSEISEDVLADEATGFKDSEIWNKLYNFQKDAVLGIINKLETFNGCILADSVGLGKTYTALAVIKYYEGRNKNVLVLCPKKLKDNWMTYCHNVKNNPLSRDRFRYDVLYHTDLSRDSGNSAMNQRLENINWGNYDLVVIDESHNFRNGADKRKSDNRYSRLMEKVIKDGVKTKVLMLSATPVNNRLNDLKNQLALACGDDFSQLDTKLDTKSGVESIFRQAQAAYNSWNKLTLEKRTTANLIKKLNHDFFDLLDSVTIARSRKHIQKYYDTTEIGSFPKRKKPMSFRPGLTDLSDSITYSQVYDKMMELNLHVYTPSAYLLPGREEKYADAADNSRWGITRAGREEGIRRLMSINLLKRMESSVHSFSLTAGRICDYLEATEKLIERFMSGESDRNLAELLDRNDEDFDLDDRESELFSVGGKLKIDLNDIDCVAWRKELVADRKTIEELKKMVSDITADHDGKLIQLKNVISEKQNNPINAGNRKILIFTAFADTAEYLYENIAPFAKESFGLNTALITGTIAGRSTCKTVKADMNDILTCFSPVSKEKALLMPDNREEIDILIATDCISEGQNLQDCDYCINYDIHWNPVRIVQRFGRIDRIGSVNDIIQLVNFWPDLELDDYINLKGRVESRMKLVDMTATGDENVISEENADLEYRQNQLKRLQDEVVDLEDLSSGISIADLGLNDFRLDLLNYTKKHPEINRVPLGIHAVVRGENPGVIFVLKSTCGKEACRDQNLLYPYYLVYVGNDGATFADHLQPRLILEQMRSMAKGKTEPVPEVCNQFNAETDDGKNMSRIKALLEDAASSIIEVKEESDASSLFKPGGTSLLEGKLSSLDSFELITFMVVMK